MAFTQKLLIGCFILAPVLCDAQTSSSAIQGAGDEYSPPYHKDGEGPQYKGEDAAIYNRNQDSHAIEDVVRWYDYWHERPGTGRRVNAGGVNIIFSESNTHYRGAENYRRSGEVDAMRIPKDGFYVHQVVWDGWVDIEKPRIHIIGHWGLQASLEKGPTPVGGSYNPSRIPLTIRTATAGANTDRAAASYDDNETTTWSNDGQLSAAWIQYELAQPTAIREIALKLNSFRTRSYPLRVTIDGKEVFRGLTPKNLGYTTLSFLPCTGSTVRIELMTGSDRSGTAGKEVNGKSLDDGIKNDNDHLPGQLSIIEAEIYAGSSPRPTH